MADNYTALKSSQKKRYISKETFNSLDLSQIPVGSEYEVVSPIEKGDLSADINNALNKAEKSISEPTNQTTGSDGDVLVKKGGGSEWKSMPGPGVVQGTGQSTTDVMSQKATTDSLAYEVDIKFETDIDYNYGEVEILTSNVGNKFTVKLTDIYGAALKDSIAVGMAIDILDSNKDTLALGISVISYIDYTTGEIHIEFKGSRSFSDGDVPAGGFISVVNTQFYGPIILPTEIRDLLLTNKSAVFKCSNDIYSLYHVNSSNTMRIYVVGTWGYSDNSFSSTRFILLVRDGTSSGTWYASRMNSAQIYDWNGEAVYRSTQVQIAVNKNIIAQPTFLFITFTGKEFTCTQSAYNQLFKDIQRIDWGDNSPITDYKHIYSQNNDYIINFIPYPNSTIELPSNLLSGIAGLKKIVVGDNVTKIGSGLCQGCTTLEEFVIGKNVTDITSFSIISDTPIKILRVLATTPPTCATYDAQVPNLEKIIVPKSAINAYKAATGWSTYADKIVYEVDSSDIPDTSNLLSFSVEVW